MSPWTWLLFFLLPLVQANDPVLGCGGFIQASRTIDFSRINVALYSRTGALKYETDCAPNNGYFFIPVYEKGEYTVKVSPPLGWKFSPSEVTIDINGVTDPCSTNQDINFVFAGFGVVGRVVTPGSTRGPAGVTINLLGQSGDTVQTTVTGDGGDYVFTAVPGTDHRVSASHPSWTFTKSEGSVSMTGDNGQAEDLVVAGFDVRGQVMSDSGASMQDVSIVLYGDSSSPALEHCPSNSPSLPPLPGLKQLCHVTTDSAGRWMIAVVPSGEYTVRASYRGELTEYLVLPATVSLSVGLDSVQLPHFTVAGFTSKGEVVAQPEGKGLEGVTVTLSGEKVLTAVTDTDGGYIVDRMESGSYTLTGKREGLQFPSLSVTVSPTSPALPSLSPTHYKLSGQLDFSSASYDSERILLLSPKDSDQAPLSVATSKSGVFQTMVTPGLYSVTVQPSSNDLEAGIVFAPQSLDVKVLDTPVSGLYFSPVRVAVSGSISCLLPSGCPDLVVTLKPEGFGQEVTQVAKEGSFSFENQLPGSYIVKVEESGLCWKNHLISFSIESEPVDNLHFQQTGWIMEVVSSHETVLTYTGGELHIPVGPSSHCLASPGPYTMSTSSCHTFQPGSHHTWSSSTGVLRLQAVTHLVTGRVTSVDRVDDLQMMIHSGGETKAMALTQPEEKDGLYHYKFGHQAAPHEELAMEPIASKFLVTPPRLHLLVSDDCQLDAIVFTATKGLFVSGRVSPPLAEVLVTLESETLPEKVQILTDEKGAYSLGPFPRDLKYTVKAERLGYVLAEMEGEKGSFTAKKLASVLVQLSDGDGTQLSGVLVSLSGGESNYRTNEQTGPNGSLSFLALSPGEYFVKPVLKEYDFTPKSKLITVTEGAEEIVNIVGKKVAFSLFGSLTGLKGEPEPGVTVEAVGQGECGKYQEESTSGQDGKFRIRGLQPTCQYLLGLKSSRSNVHVERTIPATRSIRVDHGDITGVEMIAIRPKTNMDVSLLVKVKKADSVKNIKAKLFCGSGDSPVHMMKMDGQRFVIFPSIPLDGSECYITVEASATQASHRVKAGRVYFNADKPIEHHKVELELESSLGRGDIGQASWLTLPIIILLVTTVLQWDKVSPVVLSAAGTLERMVIARRTVSPIRTQQVDMSEDDINKAVKFVETRNGPRKMKVKPTHYTG